MRSLALAIVLLLASCATRPPVAESPASGLYRNACLPEAAMMAQSLRAKSIPAKVLGLTTATWAHALCIYTYPPGQNQLWAWDERWKSLRLHAFFDNPSQIARAWMSATAHPETLISAEYLE